jgi:hypothetical protein
MVLLSRAFAAFVEAISISNASANIRYGASTTPIELFAYHG